MKPTEPREDIVLIVRQRLVVCRRLRCSILPTHRPWPCPEELLEDVVLIVGHLWGDRFMV